MQPDPIANHRVIAEPKGRGRADEREDGAS